MAKCVQETEIQSIRKVTEPILSTFITQKYKVLAIYSTMDIDFEPFTSHVSCAKTETCTGFIITLNIDLTHREAI